MGFWDRLFKAERPKLILFCAPGNPSGQILPQELVNHMMDAAIRAGSYMAIDRVYQCQCFRPRPAYFSWSPRDYPNLIGIHSNSKWARALGRRLGWIVANSGVVDGMERIQQCNILCPDALAQMTMARYLKQAIPSGSLRRYIEDTSRKYAQTARVMIEAIDAELGLPRLEPQGGLYTVLDVGRDGDEFSRQALQNTHVLVVSGKGFGRSLKNGVRLSYGPMVHDHAKIREGLARLGRWLKRT